MFAFYLRVALIIAGLIGAVILFAFAFTAAAIIVLVLLLVGLVFGRGMRSRVFVWRGPPAQAPRPPLTIDHNPDDLPPTRKPD
jgi:disulfide bond formation protein DsbB